MSNVSLPPPPYSTPVTTSNGTFSLAWANWIKQLFLRTGGVSAPANSSFSSALSSLSTVQANVASLSSTVTTLSNTVTALTSETNGLRQGRDL